MAIPTAPGLAAGAYATTNRLPALTGAAGAGGGSGSAMAGTSFSSVLKDVIDAVSESGAKADVQATAAAMGKANMVDLVTAVTESETAIATLVSVRDKVIAAYQDILKMPI